MSRFLLICLVALLPCGAAFGQVNYEVAAAGQGPEPDVTDDGWDGEAIRITYDGEANQSNGVAWPGVVTGPYDRLEFDFELRFSNEDGGGDADGIGFAYANLEDVFEDVPVWPTGEEPNLAGSVGVGFDTWMNGDLDGGFPNATLPNSFSLHYDGQRLLTLTMEEVGLDDDWLQNATPKRAHIEIRPSGNDATLTLTVQDLDSGEIVTPFEGESLPGFVPYDGQVVFRGRTGGENSNSDVDNVSLTHTPPGGAPSTTVLYGSHVGAGGGVPQLQAGDADQDLDFDQLDLVQVQIGGKYLSGSPAIWGEGDWDGAPGGSQGSPPTGNGRFDQIDIIAALNAGVYLTGPYAALADGGQTGDGQTSIVYNAGTGEVSVDAPAGVALTSVNIDSAGSIFTGAAAANLGGSFDNDADGNIFKATFGGSFGSTSFGNVAQTGLSKDFVLNDLTVVGSLAGGGALGNVDLIYVPEPSSWLMLAMGLAAIIRAARRRRIA